MGRGEDTQRMGTDGFAGGNRSELCKGFIIVRVGFSKLHCVETGDYDR
jgi:hypothetical protein